MRLGTQPGLITQYMLTDQDPTLTASEQRRRGGTYSGSSRLGVESRLQNLHLPEPQFPHPKNGSNKTHLRKLGQDPGHRDNFLTFKVPAKCPQQISGERKQQVKVQLGETPAHFKSSHRVWKQTPHGKRGVFPVRWFPPPGKAAL